MSREDKSFRRSALLSFRFLFTAVIGSVLMGLVAAFGSLTSQLAMLGCFISILGGLFLAYLGQEDKTEWVSRLSRKEFDALADLYEHAQDRKKGVGGQQVTVREALAHAADHCFERRSSVSAKELLSEALRYGVGSFAVEDAWKLLEADGRFTAEVDGRLMVASREVLVEEQRLVEIAKGGRASIAVGDRVRVTHNGLARGDHRLNNGEILTVRGFTTAGDLIDQRGWVISREFSHLSHGYVTTSVSSQSKTVNHVLVAMGTQSLPAVSHEQLYVSLSRGRDSVRIYTDDRDALRRTVARTEERLSAIAVAARRRAGSIHRKRLRQHVLFLQRLVANERVNSVAAVDRPRERVAELFPDKGLINER